MRTGLSARGKSDKGDSYTQGLVGVCGVEREESGPPSRRPWWSSNNGMNDFKSLP